MQQMLLMNWFAADAAARLGRCLDLGKERRNSLDLLAPWPGAELGQLPGVLGERRQQPPAGLREGGDEQQGDGAQALGEVVEDLVEALGVGLVLGQLPRPRLLDVAGEPPDPLPGPR